MNCWERKTKEPGNSWLIRLRCAGSLDSPMPELPDISSYLVALRRQIVGQRLETIHVRSPYLVHTVTPELESLIGETVQDLSRIGKRIVWHFSQERYLIFHLMIAGRYHWKKPGTRPSGKNDLAAFGFT